MLDVASAAKGFGGRTIFKEFHLTLEPGCFKVLVGPSGCGKSTLFDGLTGVNPLDSGTLSWQGRVLKDLRGCAAYMQQKDLLLPWFTLLDNSLLPVRTAGIGKRNLPLARQKAEVLFRRLGLAGYESYYPDQVSGGMRQRCALVRTLMFERDLILLDEPLSALDAITRQGLQSMLLMLQTEFDKTILMITHDIEEALVLGDEILLLGRPPMTVNEVIVPRVPKPRAFDHPEILTLKRRVMDRLQNDCHEERCHERA